jgi:hypothetical protein
MAIKNWSIIKSLTSQYTGENYCSLLKGTGREFVVNFVLTSEVNNPALPAFAPPSPPGLQYQADREAQIREYAANLAHYNLQLWERTSEGIFFRKNLPIYKYFPDHQLDIYPLLWSTTEAGIGEKELLLKFENNTVLPTVADKISVSLDYYTSQVNEVWFSVDIPAGQEISFQLADNYQGYSFKQRLGSSPLRWALAEGLVLTTGYDILDPAFEQTRDDVIDKKIFFWCEVATVVLIKVWS